MGGLPPRTGGFIAKNKYLNRGVILVTALCVLGVLYFAYRWRTYGFEWGAFARALIHFDWRWLLGAVAFVMLSYVGRAFRWEVMLRPIRPKSNMANLISATMTGFAAVVLFGRPGEVVRPYLIALKEEVSFSSQVAAWFVERIFDLLTVMLVFGLALSQVSHSGVAHRPRIQEILEASGYAVGIIAAVCLIFLYVMQRHSALLRKRLLYALGFLPAPALEKVERAITSFTTSFESTQTGNFLIPFIFYTCVEWALIVGSFVCLFKAFPATAHLRLTDTVVFMGFVAFGSAVQIPGVGGGIQVAAVFALTELFGVSLEAATGFAIVLWIVTFVMIVPVGLVLAFREGLTWKKLRRLEEDVSL